MALDKVLKIYDENGNEVDYDILAKDVKFLPDGKDLPTKLGEMEQDIDEAASGGYAPPEGGIPATDLAQAVQDILNDVENKVDKIPGKGLSTEDFTAALKAKLEALDPYTKAQVDAAIQQALSGIAGVSVTTNQDGTFTIHVGDTDYTISLNHTHENMAKIVKCTEATRPQTLDNDTIYVQVDDLTDPQDIESLWLFGLEFTGGGGGGASNTPFLSSPGSSVSMGDSENGSVTKVIRVKGRYLTQNLSASLTGSGYTFSAVQPTGVTRNSDTSLTISYEAARTGVDISVVYTGTSLDAAGELAITSSSPDNIEVYTALKANEIDTDGLIGRWDAADSPSNGAWVDRINSMKLNLGGTAAKVTDGYQLNNLALPKAAWMTIDSSDTTLADEITNEFTCVIECLVKFTTSAMSASIIDFGVGGTGLSTAAFNAVVRQEKLSISIKRGGNTSVTPTVKDDAFSPILAVDTYIPVTLRCGAYLENGNQVFYVEFGNKRVYGSISPAADLDFAGCTQFLFPFSLGIGYLSAEHANQYYGNYLSDVIYKTILIYNKKK